MKLKRAILAALVCLSLSLPAGAENYDYGLHITTYPHSRDEMTSVMLECGRPFAVGKRTFSITFSMFTRPENVFGTIARVITDKGDNIDLMYTVGDDNFRNAMLVNGEYVTDVKAPAPVGRWVKVSLTLNPRSGDVNLNFDNTLISVKDAGTKGARSFRVALGLCPFDGYLLDDVASVDIKDVEVRIADKLVRRWDLGVHEGDICYDELSHSPAVTTNPNWILDKYITWHKIFSTEFDREPHITFDNCSRFLMTLDGSEVVSYDVADGKETRLTGCFGDFPANAPNQVICIGNGELLAYNLDENKFATFNPSTRRWNGGSLPSKDHDYWNNTSLWDEETRTLFSFGGYGHYRYKNTLLLLHPDNPEDRWETAIPEITPRYSPSSCLVDSLIYIFGGRGNLSSRQELSPRYYYDLYTIDKSTFEVTPLWNVDSPLDGEFIPGSNMIYDREKDCFYVIGYGGDIFTLIKIGRSDGSMEKISVPTQRNVKSQYIHINLHKTEDMMYCSEVRSTADGKSIVTIFDMSYPPIPASVLEATTRKPEPEKDRKTSWSVVLISILAASLITIAAAYHLSRKRSAKEAAAKKKAQFETEDEFISTHYYDFSKSSICFFGGFCVKDREGKDITALFTPTLKYLTILLILYSAKNPQGIISGKLNTLLWSYKPEEAANNNRNVYMSKLRTLLEGVGDIKIKSQNKFWNIEFGEGSICDYLEVKRLYGEKSSEENIDRLLELLLRGMMLPNVELDWVDKFKGDFSNATIDFLCHELDRSDLRASVLLQAANTIFMHDYLNEDALRTKCRLLYNQGKVGLSKKIYDDFIKEYNASIGMAYPVQYKDLIGSGV